MHSPRLHPLRNLCEVGSLHRQGNATICECSQSLAPVPSSFRDVRRLLCVELNDDLFALASCNDAPVVEMIVDAEVGRNLKLPLDQILDAIEPLDWPPCPLQWRPLGILQSP